jgi:hypothetical protein
LDRNEVDFISIQSWPLAEYAVDLSAATGICAKYCQDVSLRGASVAVVLAELVL